MIFKIHQMPSLRVLAPTINPAVLFWLFRWSPFLPKESRKLLFSEVRFPSCTASIKMTWWPNARKTLSSRSSRLTHQCLFPPITTRERRRNICCRSLFQLRQTWIFRSTSASITPASRAEERCRFIVYLRETRDLHSGKCAGSISIFKRVIAASRSVDRHLAAFSAAIVPFSVVEMTVTESHASDDQLAV